MQIHVIVQVSIIERKKERNIKVVHQFRYCKDVKEHQQINKAFLFAHYHSNVWVSTILFYFLKDINFIQQGQKLIKNYS